MRRNKNTFWQSAFCLEKRPVWVYLFSSLLKYLDHHRNEYFLEFKLRLDFPSQFEFLNLRGQLKLIRFTQRNHYYVVKLEIPTLKVKLVNRIIPDFFQTRLDDEGAVPKSSYWCFISEYAFTKFCLVHFQVPLYLPIDELITIKLTDKYELGSHIGQSSVLK